MTKSLRSPAVTTKGPDDEPYPAFQARVAEDEKRVKAKCAALDKFTPRCTFCGETCHPLEAGRGCYENGVPMVSRWASEKAQVEWFRLYRCRGAWSNEVTALAALLDRVRAGETKTP